MPKWPGTTPAGTRPCGHDLGEILKAGHRAKELVKQILAFSRQETSESMPTSAADIIREAVKMLRPSLPSTIEIPVRTCRRGPTVFADPSQLHQVVINLCTNAYHAMEETGGILSISTQKSPNSQPMISAIRT